MTTTKERGGGDKHGEREKESEEREVAVCGNKTACMI
jgi:hypothetical protein